MNILSDLTGQSAPDAQPQPLNTPEPGTGPIKVLRAVAHGQLPGVLVPSGAPELPETENLTPEDLLANGIGSYRPKTEGLDLVLFNTQRVPLAELEKLDADGGLGSAFPSITELLGGPPSNAPQSDEASSAPATIPIERGPSRPSGAAVKPLLGTEPSKRPLPGAGLVLNGLVQRAV